MVESLEAMYFDWLYARVMLSDAPAVSYSRLIQELYETEFIFLMSGDDNRAEDGIALRDEFIQNLRFEVGPHELSFGCSVLEMMIALSVKAEFQTDIRPSQWFWEFIANLGLSDYYDDQYNQDEVQFKLHNFVWRTYEYNGTGGMFPLKRPETDQRGIEIWYQFSAYLIEKHFF